MSMRRTIVVLIVVFTFAVPDLLACGDKFLLAGRGARYQHPKNARAANVLIYAVPGSAMAAAIKKEKTESILKVLGGHRTDKAETLEKLSTMVSNGRYDVILTSNGDSANVRKLVQASPAAPSVVGIDDLLKNYSLLATIDKEVVQRDQNLKHQVLKNQNLKKK